MCGACPQESAVRLPDGRCGARRARRLRRWMSPADLEPVAGARPRDHGMCREMTSRRQIEDSGTDDHERVVISSPEELIASVPSMLGYPPSPGSVVIVCGRIAGGGTGPVMSIVVPGLQDDGIPDYQDLVDSIDWIDDDDDNDDRDRGMAFMAEVPTGIGQGAAQEIARFCEREGVESAHLIVVREGCTTDHFAGIRADDAASAFQYWLGLAGTEIVGAYGVDGFAEGKEWVDLFGIVRGVQLDPDATHIAAVHAFEGRVRADSRDQIADLYAVRDDDACDVEPIESGWGARARRKDARGESTWDGMEARLSGDVGRHDAAARRMGAGEKVDDDELAAIGRSLLDAGVRDEVYRRLAQCKPDDADGRQELWWRLARRRPPRERSVALLLLGAASYFAGSGVHAMFAFEAALEADYQNSLARLLMKGLTQGLSPERLRRAAAVA